MDNPNSYENVMRELEELNDRLEAGDDLSDDEDEGKDFKYEYAHESLTERHSAYKRRYGDV